MKVTAWNNGQYSATGAGYGVKLSIQDRDREFDRGWKAVTLELENGKSIRVKVAKKSFWSEACRELIHAEIGLWMLAQGLAPWPKGHPPKLQLISTGEAKFKLCRRS
ncbi:hypothetical protein [Nitrosococcus wardiae]|uniref:Uncharacterized protein n=1 Tax=Nitrosococcus wardiae TaxID=1814290 RepID=A0A4P7C1M3_9GAMM|nr:hypothetical protein [Nitrosococcus wardiae]QBQ54782.1 hypothetical protein E3U44_09890 [Nitrosococcus wardiae]